MAAELPAILPRGEFSGESRGCPSPIRRRLAERRWPRCKTSDLLVRHGSPASRPPPSSTAVRPLGATSLAVCCTSLHPPAHIFGVVRTLPCVPHRIDDVPRTGLPRPSQRSSPASAASSALACITARDLDGLQLFHSGLRRRDVPAWYRANWEAFHHFHTVSRLTPHRADTAVSGLSPDGLPPGRRRRPGLRWPGIFVNGPGIGAS